MRSGDIIEWKRFGLGDHWTGTEWKTHYNIGMSLGRYRVGEQGLG